MTMPKHFQKVDINTLQFTLNLSRGECWIEVDLQEHYTTGSRSKRQLVSNLGTTIFGTESISTKIIKRSITIHVILDS